MRKVGVISQRVDRIDWVKYGRAFLSVVSNKLSPMSEVKLYKITGDLRKRGEKLHFTKQIRALKKEHALQSLYADMGSRHKARKFDITIKTVEEIAELREGA